MHECILNEHWFKAKFLSAKPCEAFLIDKGLQRMKIGHKDIYSHVKFVAI